MPPGDGTIGEFGFGFTRFGVRVPAVLVSPLIGAGTVYRATQGRIDHAEGTRNAKEAAAVLAEPHSPLKAAAE